MASARTLAWLDGAAWALIYGGLIALVLGIAAGGESRVAGWSLGVLGGIAAIAGVAMIVVRSRLRAPAEPGAQSTAPQEGKKTR